MDKIIEPVSYKKMVESYTHPVHVYGKKISLKEGVGAGYDLTFLGIKLTNVKVEEPQKDEDGVYTARFTADIVPGEYNFFADHPYWSLGSLLPDMSGTRAARGWKKYFVDIDNCFDEAVITGGKVEGVCDDGGQRFTSWNSDDNGPGWTEEDYIREIESEEFILGDIYGGGYAHSPLRTEIEFEYSEGNSYFHAIDQTEGDYNDATILKATFNFDPDWVADYNDAVDRAIYGDDDDESGYEADEEDWEDDEDIGLATDDRQAGQWYESKMKESKSEDIKYLKYLLRKEEVTALDDEERWELQDLINKYGYPEEYEESKKSNGKRIKEAMIPTANDPDILDFVSTFKDTLGGSQKKREAALEELESIGDSLVETYPELEGKTPSEIARWCRSVLDGTWRPIKESYEEDDFYVNPEDYDKEGTYEEYLRYCAATNGDPMSEEEWRWTTGIYESKKTSESKLEEDAITSKVRQGVLEINAARDKVDTDVEKLDRTVNKVTNDMVSAVLNHKPLQEAAGRHVEVDFPIHVSEDGLISEGDARKLLRKLAADHKLRVGSHYDVYDSEANLTTWDFNASKDPGFGYTFECNIVGNGISYNAFYLNKKRNKVNLKDAVWVSDTTMGKMTESSRYTHRIVLKTNDPDAPLRYRMTHADTMRYRSEEEAKKALDDYNNRIGARLDGKGLHLEIEEIPYTPRPRDTRTQDPDYENPFEVGDILEGDFGYSMILPVWVQVISKTAKTVTVRRLEDKVVSHDGYGQAGTKRPIPNSFAKGWGDSYEEKKCIVKKGYNRDKSDNPKKDYFILFEGKILRIWDGEDRDFDTYD